MAVTIGWMLATLATALALVVSFVAAALHPLLSGGMFLAVSRYLLITSALTGILAIVLIPVVRRVRPDRPPAAIEWTAAILGTIPWLWIAWIVLQG